MCNYWESTNKQRKGQHALVMVLSKDIQGGFKPQVPLIPTFSLGASEIGLKFAANEKIGSLS